MIISGTCAADACYQQWKQGKGKTIPVIEAALVQPNLSDPTRLDMRFADGSQLTVSFANDGFNLFWSEE